MPPPIIPQKPIFMFGAYVSNLSVSIGWGGQGGSLQVTLVEDPANGIIIPKENGEVDGTGNPFLEPIILQTLGLLASLNWGSSILLESFKDGHTKKMLLMVKLMILL